MQASANAATFTAYRLVPSAHADSAFSGAGSRLYDGRWHFKGCDIAYVADSRALAVLEQLVHTTVNLLPLPYQCFAVTVPKGLALSAVRPENLPANWRDTPIPAELQQIGDTWLADKKTAVLRVPSALIPQEDNFILNLQHQEFSQLAISAPTPLDLDARLLTRAS